MTKKDYELIATAIRIAKMKVRSIKTEQQASFHAGICQAELDITYALADENSRFDEVKFRKACEL